MNYIVAEFSLMVLTFRQWGCERADPLVNLGRVHRRPVLQKAGRAFDQMVFFVLLGALIVLFGYPGHAREREAMAPIEVKRLEVARERRFETERVNNDEAVEENRKQQLNKLWAERMVDLEDRYNKDKYREIFLIL